MLEVEVTDEERDAVLVDLPAPCLLPPCPLLGGLPPLFFGAKPGGTESNPGGGAIDTK